MTVSTKPRRSRAWVEVNLANLVANARTVAAQGRGAALLPMVKADAYGLGVVPVVRALEALGPWGYGVTTLEEGIELRKAGVQRPVVVFTPALPDQLQLYREYQFRAVVDRPEVGARWEAPFHLEIDTGMGRCGVRWDDAAAIARCATPHLEGAFTHFSAADQGVEPVEWQWSRFEQALVALGRRPKLVHAANSAAVWRLDRRLDLVRPGIFLYGGEHAADLAPPLPVATVRAPVVSLRRLPAGEPVSYGGEWVAPQPTTVATLGMGYADGVACAVQQRASVLIAGARRPVVGRVTMDFIMVALEDTDRVGIGDVATLLGSDGDGEISLAEFARWSGTISYEVLVRLGGRLPRQHLPV